MKEGEKSKPHPLIPGSEVRREVKLKMATVALLVLGLGVQLQVGVARAAAGETLPSPDLSLAIFTQGVVIQAKSCRSLKVTLFTSSVNRSMHKLTL